MISATSAAVLASSSELLPRVAETFVCSTAAAVQVGARDLGRVLEEVVVDEARVAVARARAGRVRGDLDRAATAARDDNLTRGDGEDLVRLQDLRMVRGDKPRLRRRV